MSALDQETKDSRSRNGSQPLDAMPEDQDGTDGAPEAERDQRAARKAASSTIDSLNANADFWSEWQANREERWREEGIQGETPQENEEATTEQRNGRQRGGIWSKLSGPRAPRHPGSPNETAEPDAASSPEIGDAPPEEEVGEEELADFWDKWAAKAAIAPPEHEEKKHEPKALHEIEGVPEEPARPRSRRPAPQPAAPEPVHTASDQAASEEIQRWKTQVDRLRQEVARFKLAEQCRREERAKRLAGEAAAAGHFVEQPVVDADSEHDEYWTQWQTTIDQEFEEDSQRTSKEVRSIRKKFLIATAAVLILSFAAGFGAAAYHYRADKLAVAVNGKGIPQSEYVHDLEIQAGMRGLDQIINNELNLQFATKKGLAPTAAQVNARVDEIRKRPDYAGYLRMTRQTLDDVKKSVRYQLAGEAITTQGVTVSDDELRAYYNANTNKKNPKSAFFNPETVRVRVIVVPKLEIAQKALREVKMGISFETVARHYSKDTSAPNGGLLPPIGYGRTPLKHVPGMETFLFGLRPGEVLGPQQFMGAWFIAKCEAHTQAYTATFDSVKELCRKAIIRAKGITDNGAKNSEEFNDFRKKSNIVVLHP
jgi:parvulin-like peptidyl-prolyl isomerase